MNVEKHIHAHIFIMFQNLHRLHLNLTKLRITVRLAWPEEAIVWRDFCFIFSNKLLCVLFTFCFQLGKALCYFLS